MSDRHPLNKERKGNEGIDFSCFLLDEMIRITNFTKNKKANFSMFFKRTYSS